jgi:hypothetical protein
MWCQLEFLLRALLSGYRMVVSDVTTKIKDKFGSQLESMIFSLLRVVLLA